MKRPPIAGSSVRITGIARKCHSSACMRAMSSPAANSHGASLKRCAPSSTKSARTKRGMPLVPRRTVVPCLMSPSSAVWLSKERTRPVFYLIEVAIGDDNDQSISDLVLYANTKERVIDAIDLHFKQELTAEDFDHDSVERDGDVSSHVGLLWYEDAIPYHADYYVSGSFSSLDEAVAA